MGTEVGLELTEWSFYYMKALIIIRTNYTQLSNFKDKGLINNRLDFYFCIIFVLKPDNSKFTVENKYIS